MADVVDKLVAPLVEMVFVIAEEIGCPIAEVEKRFMTQLQAARFKQGTHLTDGFKSREDQMWFDFTSFVLSEYQKHAFSNYGGSPTTASQTIRTIKALRRFAGDSKYGYSMGLREAKDFVDKVVKDHAL